VHAPTIEIHNDVTLDAAGERLIQSLHEWMDASRATVGNVLFER
jgi:hypothetical protein